MKRTLFILLIFLFCLYSQVSEAAETTYYVDVDVVGGAGDGSSLANAYSSLNTAEAAREADITAGDAVRFLVHNTLGGTDSLRTNFLGWTTDSDSYIKVEAAAAYRHSGVWDASKYHIETTDSNGIDINEDYVRLDGLQLHLITTGATYRSINVNSINIANLILFSNLIIKGDVTGTGAAQGIQVDDTDAIVKIWNCIIYNFISASNPTDSGFVGIISSNATTIDIWNCTINDCRRGIVRGATGGTVTVVNSLVFENDDDFGGTITMTYSASDDDHTGDSATNFVITQTADDYAALVVDADGRDYNVTDKDSELVGTGTDDPGGAIQGDTDIAGNARISTWDIGAFEYVAVPSVRIKGSTIRIKGAKLKIK